MRFRPASWPWLLVHELRLHWRGLSDNIALLLVLGGLLWLILHIVALFVMRNMPNEIDGTALVIAGLIVWFAGTLMLSAATVLAVKALFDRGDLDLLISSPLPVRSIFIVRGIGVAITAVILFAALLLPFAHAGIVHGRFGFTAVYPVLAAMALGAAGVGFALTLILVRWFGARRARVLAQVLSALIGAVFFLTLQAGNIVPEAVRERWTPRLLDYFQSASWLSDNSPLWWPVRALFGEALPALMTVALGIGIFSLVVVKTSRAFVSGTQESVSARARRSPTPAEQKFRQGLARNVMSKELKLIARDPDLIAKTLLQGLYLVPMIVIVARQGEIALVFASAIIVLLASIAGNLAWITIAGEEAPDLVGTAPVNRSTVRWLKAAAALKPLAFVAVPVVVFYLLRSPVQAIAFALFLALALIAAAITQVWGSKPSSTRDLQARQKQNILLNLFEFVGTLVFSGAFYLTLIGFWWALLLIPFGFVGPALAWTQRNATLN